MKRLRFPVVLPDRDERYRCLLIALSGLLEFSAFPPLDFPWAGWISFVPLTIALVVFPSRQKILWKEGLVFGGVFFFPTLFWVGEVSWAGWMLLSAIMSLYPALWLIFTAGLLRDAFGSLGSVKNLYRASLGAFFWVGLEWIRGWMLTGFPWNFLGVSQWRMVGVIQIAEWGGVLLVSWLVVFVSMVLGLTLIRLVQELKRRQPIRPHFEFTVGMLVLGLAVVFGMHILLRRDAIEKTVTVLAVQPDIPQNPWGNVISTEEALATLEVWSISGLNRAGTAVDLVVWPETPIGEEMYSSTSFREALKAIRMSLEHQVSLLMGSTVCAGTKLYNAAMLYPGGGGPPQVYYKNHLVLMGEVVPLPDWIPFLHYFVPLGQNFSSGTAATILTVRTRDGDEIRLAPLICFEDVFGTQARRYRRGNPDMLVNITNDGWFNRSFQSRQHLANAVFRAIENRMPLLRVSNNGITALVSEKGIVHRENLLGELGKESSHQSGTLLVTAGIPAAQYTFYQQWGDWVGILGALLLGGYLSARGKFVRRIFSR